jgi:DNA polymerase III subunit beta
MKCIVQTDSLRSALSKMASVSDKRHNRPILGYALLSYKNKKMELSATDGEVSVKVLLDAETEGEAEFCIGSKHIFELIRDFPHQEVVIHYHNGENRISIVGNKIKYSLSILNNNEFPYLYFQNTDNAIQLKASVFSKLISKTIHAISLDETLIQMNGIYFHSSEDSLNAVALDGHRLSISKSGSTEEELEVFKEGIIIPKKGLAELKKLCDPIASDLFLKISLDESNIYFNYQDTFYLTIRLVTREFPKYQSVVPPRTVYQVKLTRTQFTNVVKRVKIMANEKSHGVKLIFNSGELSVLANHPSLGNAHETLEIDYDGKEMEFGLNAKYLIDALSIYDSDIVTLEINNEFSPVIISSPDDKSTIGLIMPMKII